MRILRDFLALTAITPFQSWHCMRQREDVQHRHDDDSQNDGHNKISVPSSMCPALPAVRQAAKLIAL